MQPTQKCFVQRKEDVVRTWYHVDAEPEILGRLAARIAVILMGKHKPTYTPYVDCGDFVVVTNASKVRVTGNKVDEKMYFHHTGYLGHLRSHSLHWMLEHKPDQVIRRAVRLMLPKSKLGRQMLRKLKVYAGAEHPHGAQAPEPLPVRVRGAAAAASSGGSAVERRSAGAPPPSHATKRG